MKITGFDCLKNSGGSLPSDAFGNNLAASCPVCGHPVLFVALANQKGSASSHATVCKGCGRNYYISINETNSSITVHEKH